MIDHSLVITLWDWRFPSSLAPRNIAGVRHRYVGALRGPPHTAVAVSEIGLPGYRHNLGQASRINLAYVGVIQAERSCIHVLIAKVDAGLYTGKKIIAYTSIERGTIKLVWNGYVDIRCV